MPAVANRYASFLLGLRLDVPLPGGISIINPYTDTEVRRVVKSFCSRFYSGNNKRILILGINPGRFGAGVTGIPFTDPVALDKFCGISNSFSQRKELSSKYVYEVISAFGGVNQFYERFMIGSVCPLGFLKGEKNCNFYDESSLVISTSEFIGTSLKQQIEIAGRSDHAIVFGKKNADLLSELNREMKLFEKIHSLEHPRYIMQYKSNELERYVTECVRLLQKLVR